MIKDIEGNVMVFYHGTPGEAFEEFDLSKSTRNRWESGEIYFFALEKEIAENYAEGNGSIIKVNLKANKIFDTVKNKEDKEIYDRLVMERLENGDDVYTQGQAEEGYADEQSFGYPDNWVSEYENSYPYFENNDWLVDKIKALGYDAVITSEGNAKIGIAVLGKEQIKIIREA